MTTNTTDTADDLGTLAQIRFCARDARMKALNLMTAHVGTNTGSTMYGTINLLAEAIDRLCLRIAWQDAGLRALEDRCDALEQAR